jgi:competence ComEA-like helix-hairpin-helix protein
MCNVRIRKTQDIRHRIFSTCDFRFAILKIKNRKSKIGNLQSSSGLSLIAVMWIVTILAVLATEFLYSMQLEVRIAKNWSDQISAFYAAKGGLETGIAMLRDDETDHDSLDEDWAEGITGELNDSTFETILTDESAKVNVNTADEGILTKAAIAYYTISSDGEISAEEAASQAQALVAAVIEKRPYRTVAEMAKADGMTPELLYGESAETADSEERVTDENEEDAEEQSIALVDLATVYSVDKNVASDGQKRVNINSADANQIEQGVNREGESALTGEEAQAIVDYRDELGSSQSGQGQSGQGMPAQGGLESAGAMGGEGQADQGGYQGIGQLLDVPAISQEEFDAMSENITVEDEEGEGGERKININTADSGELQNLEGVDEGIAESIIRYREQKQFENIDEIRQVKAISLEDMRVIVDRVTISDDEVLQGKVNINTAPLEILLMLPGLDEEKAQAIISRREVEEGQTSTFTAPQQGGQETGPFTSLGQLLDVEGIDEDTFKNLVDHVTYRSHAYRIESEGRSSDGKIVQKCTAVVDRSGSTVEIKYWKQE